MTTTTQAPSATIATVPMIGGRVLDAKAFLGIYNSRKLLSLTYIGQQVLLMVQGNGTFMAADPEKGQMFDKFIYNVRANSQLSIARKANKDILAEAVKAESTGDVDEAAKLFNEYLNNVQVSFNVIADSGRRFASGDAITGIVAEVITKAGDKQIVLNDVRYKAPTTVADTAKVLDITALLDNSEAEEILTPLVAAPVATK